MIVLLITALCACLASFLSFFSGFGLGTVLTALFCFFYPAETAIALAAFVHLLNNLFKFFLLRKHVLLGKVLPFVFAAVPAAFIGSWVLQYWAVKEETINYTISGFDFSPKMTSFSLGIVLIVFAWLEEFLKKHPVQEKKNAVLAGGGLLSGFIGGLTGNQGALRSFFLLRVISDKQAFVATGVCIAILLDATRIPVYAWMLRTHSPDKQMISQITVAVLSAGIGVLLGNRILGKKNIAVVHLIFQWCLVAMGLALITGRL